MTASSIRYLAFAKENIEADRTKIGSLARLKASIRL